MSNYHEAKVKLANTQLNKLKPAAINNTETTLRITKITFKMAHPCLIDATCDFFIGKCYIWKRTECRILSLLSLKEEEEE